MKQTPCLIADLANELVIDCKPEHTPLQTAKEFFEQLMPEDPRTVICKRIFQQTIDEVTYNVYEAYTHSGDITYLYIKEIVN